MTEDLQSFMSLFASIVDVFLCIHVHSMNTHRTIHADDLHSRIKPRKDKKQFREIKILSKLDLNQHVG